MSFGPDGLSDCDYLSEGEVNRMIEGTGHVGAELPEFVNMWDIGAGNVPQTGVQVYADAHPGEYNFRIAVSESSTRSSYVYSSQLNRLYIDMNKVVPIKFMWNGPATLHVRAMMFYREPDFTAIAVSRCRMHEDKADPCNDGYNHPSHVLRCDDEKALYTVNDTSSRRSVITFLDHIPPGADGITVHYRMMCKTSCVAGINRRMTDIIFTLEDSNNHVVGKAILGVKICSCPRRDKEKDEAPKNKKRRSDTANVNASRMPGKVMKAEVDAEPFSVYQVRVPESKCKEFETFVSHWLAGASLPDESVLQSTFGTIVKL